MKGHVARYPRYLKVTDVRSKKRFFFFKPHEEGNL